MIKKVGNCFYVHRSNAQELLDKAKNSLLEKKILALNRGYNYQIIKYDKEKNSVSFIQSPDWETSFEPTVGDGVIFYLENETSGKTFKMKNNPQIYHHRWMFMADDSKAPYILESKKRSELLFSIPSFNKKEVKSRIGYMNYWLLWCAENGIPV